MIVKLSGMGWLVCAVLTVEVPGSFRGRDRFRGQVFAGRRHDCLMRNDVRMRMRNPGSREYGRLGEGSVSECLGGKRDEGWQDGRGGFECRSEEMLPGVRREIRKQEFA